MIGAGQSVSYEGRFERKQLTEAEKDELQLKNLFEDNEVRAAFKQLAGKDLDYILQCFFATQPIKPNDPYLKEVIEGWCPGVTPWENGILGIANSKLTLMFVDCRPKKTVIRFRTNDKRHLTVPKSFAPCLSDKKDMPIIHD